MIQLTDEDIRIALAHIKAAHLELVEIRAISEQPDQVKVIEVVHTIRKALEKLDPDDLYPNT